MMHRDQTIIDTDGPDLEFLSHVRADSISVREFAINGYSVLKGLIDQNLMRALSREAIERRPFAVFPKAGPQTPVIKSKMLRRRTPAADGPILRQIQTFLLPLVRGLTGKFLTPVFSAYGYYEGDDRVLLHIDQLKCQVTLLISLDGKVGPLHLHPELSGCSLRELGELENDLAWDRNSGIQIHYPNDGLFAFRGSVIPHHRPGSRLDGSHAVAALCYKNIFA